MVKKFFLVLFLAVSFIFLPYNYSSCNESKPESEENKTTSFLFVSKMIDQVIFTSTKDYIAQEYSSIEPEDIDHQEFVKEIYTLVTSLCSMFRIPITKPPTVQLLEVTKDGYIVNYIIWIQICFADFDENYKNIPSNVIIGKGFILYPENLPKKEPV